MRKLGKLSKLDLELDTELGHHFLIWCVIYLSQSPFNTLRPKQKGWHFLDDIFKCIFLNENVWISLKFSLKFVPRVPIDHIPALVQIMAWCQPGDKPLSETMMVRLLMHIDPCFTRPQFVKSMSYSIWSHYQWLIRKCINHIHDILRYLF